MVLVGRLVFLGLAVLFFTSSAKAHPLRVVTLNPSLTEILYDLHQENLIVGTVDASDAPAAAKKLTHIGSYGRPNIEKIIALHPDIVFTFKEGIDQIGPQLQRAHISLKAFEARTLRDFAPMIENIGHELHVEKEARALIQKWDLDWKDLQSSNEKNDLSKKQYVLLQLEQTPLIIAGGDTFLSEITNKCGWQNSFQDQNGYPTIATEALYKKKINLIAVLIENATAEKKKSILDQWRRVSSLQTSPVVFFDPHALSRLTPELPKVAKSFCRLLESESKPEPSP